MREWQIMDFSLFFGAVQAISSVAQIMMMQEERLKQFEIIHQAGGRPDLPQEYRDELLRLNLEAKQAGEESKRNPIIVSNEELRILEKKIPEFVQEKMVSNVMRCWERLSHFIDGNEYTPDERKISHIRARKCVCNELQELLNYLGTLPADLQAYWDSCGCPNPQ